MKSGVNLDLCREERRARPLKKQKKASVSEGPSQEDRSYARSLVQGLEGREKLRGHEADTEVTPGPPTRRKPLSPQGLEEQGLGKCGQSKDVSGAHGEDAADAET